MLLKKFIHVIPGTSYRKLDHSLEPLCISHFLMGDLLYAGADFVHRETDEAFMVSTKWKAAHILEH
jgi:hypothetical protein